MPRVTICHYHQVVHLAIAKHLRSAELYLFLRVPRETSLPPVLWFNDAVVDGGFHRAHLASDMVRSVTVLQVTVLKVKTLKNGANTNHTITTLLRRDACIMSQAAASTR